MLLNVNVIISIFFEYMSISLKDFVIQTSEDNDSFISIAN